MFDPDGERAAADSTRSSTTLDTGSLVNPRTARRLVTASYTSIVIYLPQISIREMPNGSIRHNARGRLDQGIDRNLCVMNVRPPAHCLPASLRMQAMRVSVGGSRCLERSSLFCGDYRGRFANHVQNFMRVRQHWNVTALHFHRRRAHPFRVGTLQFRIDGVIFAGDDVPTRLRSPRAALQLVCEQIRCGSEVSCVDDPLLFRRKVTRECLDSV